MIDLYLNLNNMSFSKISLWVSCILLSIIALFYYPKWNKDTTEATISWDVSGYYWYLPAFFIYNDVKKIEFSNQILEKYRPTPGLLQAYKHKSENYVMKYSSGQAMVLLPVIQQQKCLITRRMVFPTHISLVSFCGVCWLL